MLASEMVQRSTDRTRANFKAMTKVLICNSSEITRSFEACSRFGIHCMELGSNTSVEPKSLIGLRSGREG